MSEKEIILSFYNDTPNMWPNGYWYAAAKRRGEGGRLEIADYDATGATPLDALMALAQALYEETG